MTKTSSVLRCKNTKEIIIINHKEPRMVKDERINTDFKQITGQYPKRYGKSS